MYLIKLMIGSIMRYTWLDSWRGFAIILMIIFHTCYDINYVKWLDLDFYHNDVWLIFRIIIVSLFSYTMGISLFFTHCKKIQIKHIKKRLLILGGSALLISIVTYIVFGDRFIFFGILHFMALASVVGVFFLRFGYWNIALGGMVIIIGSFFQHTAFNTPFLQWLGMMTYKPATEDYTAFFPWFGVVLLGIYTGQYIYKNGDKLSDKVEKYTLIQRLGQHSLLIYLVHQPIIFGSILGIDYFFVK